MPTLPTLPTLQGGLCQGCQGCLRGDRDQERSGELKTVAGRRMRIRSAPAKSNTLDYPANLRQAAGAKAQAAPNSSAPDVASSADGLQAVHRLCGMPV